MKKEKGSALLTVILIVFVTATIGSALLSFVMVNYRLRALDNNINRAEYEAEKVVDIVYMAMQKILYRTVKNAQESAQAIFDEGQRQYNEALIYDIDENGDIEKYVAEDNKLNGKTYFWRELLDTGEVSIEPYDKAEQEQDQKDAYYNGIPTYVGDGEYRGIATLSNDIMNNIADEVESYGIKLIGDEEFGKADDAIEIKLEDITKDGEPVTINLKIYYKNPLSPPILFTVDFIIQLPSYEDVMSNHWNVNSWINLTNWEMQDWGYL